MNKETIKIVSALVGGASVGAIVGVLLTKTKYEQMANEEIASVKESYTLLRKEGSFETPEEAAKVLIGDRGEEIEKRLKAKFQSVVLEEGYKVDIPDTTDFGKTINIFAEDADSVEINLNTVEETDEDGNEDDPEETEETALLNRLLAERNPEIPYVISIAEFQEDSHQNYDKITLTYWDGDGTLADDAEQIVDRVEETVGTNLSYFGVGSEDENIVYIRNEDVETDFEVVRDPRSYQTTVLGIPDYENEPRRTLKMRRDDE